MSSLFSGEAPRCAVWKSHGRIGFARLLVWMVAGTLLWTNPAQRARAGEFQVQVFSSANPPPTPVLEELPLLSQIVQDGITWTFSQPQRIGRFVNGHYYVVGPVTVVGIQPLPTPTNGLHGSMLNIRPNIQRSGFDSRIASARYDPSLRVYPPITLTPGNKLISSRSAGATNPPCVMRAYDISVSPVASVSILTCVEVPQPPDAFRPSYAQGATNIYLSRNLRRQLLPRLAPVAHIPPYSEFEGYLRRPWVDSVFFNFDVAAEYMASYGRDSHRYLHVPRSPGNEPPPAFLPYATNALSTASTSRNRTIVALVANMSPLLALACGRAHPWSVVHS